MRRLSIGFSIAAMAAAHLFSPSVTYFDRVALRPDAPRISNEHRRKRSKNKKGPAPSGLTAQKHEKPRLLCDRSSSFKKLRRWARRHPDHVKQPSEAALMRHPWYRNKKAWATFRASLPAENQLA